MDCVLNRIRNRLIFDHNVQPFFLEIKTGARWVFPKYGLILKKLSKPILVHICILYQEIVFDVYCNKLSSVFTALDRAVNVHIDIFPFRVRVTQVLILSNKIVKLIFVHIAILLHSIK